MATAGNLNFFSSYLRSAIVWGFDEFRDSWIVFNVGSEIEGSMRISACLLENDLYVSLAQIVFVFLASATLKLQQIICIYIDVVIYFLYIKNLKITYNLLG